MNETEYVVYCAVHQHYLRHASAAGTNWAGDPKQARRYPSKTQARTAADAATWLDHNPAAWPVAETTAEL